MGRMNGPKRNARVLADRKSGASVEALKKAREVSLARLQNRSGINRTDTVATNPSKRVEASPDPLNDLTGRARPRVRFVPRRGA